MKNTRRILTAIQSIILKSARGSISGDAQLRFNIVLSREMPSQKMSVNEITVINK